MGFDIHGGMDSKQNMGVCAALNDVVWHKARHLLYREEDFRIESREGR
jgi:hypothetical protein